MPLSDERLTEIRDVYIDDHEVVGELLAEVERLRTEADLAASVRQWADALVRKVVRAGVAFVLGVAAWQACDHLLNEPWSILVAIPSGMAVGAALGAYWAWADDRRESSDAS